VPSPDGTFDSLNAQIKLERSRRQQRSSASRGGEAAQCRVRHLAQATRFDHCNASAAETCPGELGTEDGGVFLK